MYRYVEDWDEEVRGPFPLKSVRMDPLRKVVLNGPKGLYAGVVVREPRVIGKENGVDEDGSPKDTRRTLAPRYEAVALVEPNAQTLQSMATSQQDLIDRMNAEQARSNAKDSIRSKRERGEELTQADIEKIADLLTGRL